MKLKLKYDEIKVLISILQRVEQLEFHSTFERNVCRVVVIGLLKKLSKKLLDFKDDNSIKLDDIEIIVITNILTIGIESNDPYESMIVSRIIMKTAPLCLNI